MPTDTIYSAPPLIIQPHTTRLLSLDPSSSGVIRAHLEVAELKPGLNYTALFYIRGDSRLHTSVLENGQSIAKNISVFLQETVHDQSQNNRKDQDAPTTETETYRECGLAKP